MRRVIKRGLTIMCVMAMAITVIVPTMAPAKVSAATKKAPAKVTLQGGESYLMGALEYKNEEKAIYLNVDSSKHYDGIDFYRKKTTDKKFKKIKVKRMSVAESEYIRTKGKLRIYRDKNVQLGTKYVYKVKPYNKIKGKKVYGKFSNKCKLALKNWVGKYTVESLTPAGKVSEIILKITSDKYNGKTEITCTPNTYVMHSIVEDGMRDEVENYVENEHYVISEISNDGKEWRSNYSRKWDLYGGDTIYIKLEFINAIVDWKNDPTSITGGPEYTAALQDGVEGDEELTEYNYMPGFIYINGYGVRSNVTSFTKNALRVFHATGYFD